MNTRIEQAVMLIDLAKETGDTRIRPDQPPTKPLTTTRPKPQWRGIVIEALHARDGHTCYLCHTPLGPDPHIDHIVPLSIEGAHAMHNLALTHMECNIDKGTSIVTVRLSDRSARYLMA